MKRTISIMICLSLMVGCASMEKQVIPRETREKLPGYLTAERLPDSVALIPAPPAAGSAAFALDEEISRAGLQLRNTPSWSLAARDAELSFPAAADSFSCALNASVSEKETPHLFLLMRRTLSDVSRSVSRAKKMYGRPRPFLVNGEATCSPDYEKHMRTSGAYPSGHAAAGWAWALILSEIVPERGDALLQRGRAFGRSRIVCNVHWASDVNEGRTVAAAVVARLHADPAFRADLEHARRELAALRLQGTVPQRDCTAEAEALAVYP